MKKVALVEDQTAIRDMLEMVVSAEPGFAVIGTTGEGHMAWELCQKEQPHLVILDIMLPGLNGLEILRRLNKHYPEMRILIFSGHPNLNLVRESIRAGAHGFVEKTAGLAELRQGIRIVSEGGSYFGPEVAVFLRDAVLSQSNAPAKAETLTAREREVLQLVAESYSTKQVAAKLNVSVKTADNHRTNLMRKLDIHDVASLTRYAIESGLIANKGDTTPS